MSRRWHDLKIWPEHWLAIFLQDKSFDVRLDDRDFEVGDGLVLREWDPDRNAYTGRLIPRVIHYLQPGGQFGVEPGYVVLGLSHVPFRERPPQRELDFRAFSQSFLESWRAAVPHLTAREVRDEAQATYDAMIQITLLSGRV